MENRGFKVIGAGAFPTEHSIIRSIGLSRPNKEDMKTIAEFGIQLNRRLKQKENFDSINIQVPGNTPYRKYSRTPLYPKRRRNSGPSAVPAQSSVHLVPFQLPIQKVDKKKCIACTKCVRGCKQKAKYVSNFKMKMAYKKLTKICKSDKAADIFL